MSFSKMFGVPRQFTYRNMICDCRSINGNNGRSLAFLVYPASAITDTEAANELALQFIQYTPNDPYFKMLIATYYGLVVESVDIRYEVNENTDSTMLYMLLSCYPCRGLEQTFEEAQLFTSHLNCNKNMLRKTVQPETFKVVDTETGEETFIHILFTSILYRPFYDSTFFKTVSMYGVELIADVMNIGEVKEKLPSYNITQHPAVFNRLIELLKFQEKNITNGQICPSGYMNVTYSENFSDCANTMLRPYTLRYHVGLQLHGINGITIGDVSPAHITLRPLESNDFFNEMLDMNWEGVYGKVEDIMMSLFTSEGTFYLPNVIDREVVDIDGVPWIKFYMKPAVGSFPDGTCLFPSVFDNMGEIYNRKSFLHYIDPSKNFELLFQVYGESMPRHLCYGRINRDIMTSIPARDKIIDTFTCKYFGFNIVCEDLHWIYFTIVDTNKTFYNPETKSAHGFVKYFGMKFGHLFCPAANGSERYKSESAFFISLLNRLISSTNISAFVRDLGKSYARRILDSSDRIDTDYPSFKTYLAGLICTWVYNNDYQEASFYDRIRKAVKTMTDEDIDVIENPIVPSKKEEGEKSTESSSESVINGIDTSLPDDVKADVKIPKSFSDIIKDFFKDQFGTGK